VLLNFSERKFGIFLVILCPTAIVDNLRGHMHWFVWYGSGVRMLSQGIGEQHLFLLVDDEVFGCVIDNTYVRIKNVSTKRLNISKP
jgi:hypothetical protein